MSDASAKIRLEVDVSGQTLRVLRGSRQLRRYPVSTASAGTGQGHGSGRTPLGLHRIRIKVGEGEPLNRVFVGRRPTGEIYSEHLAQQYPQRDWILTRILWLTGREAGLNRGGSCDSLRRYIYIHGTPDSEPMGVPASHGCIRMRNHQLLELFDLVEPDTEVSIIA